jgi:hypothetical protein
LEQYSKQLKTDSNNHKLIPFFASINVQPVMHSYIGLSSAKNIEEQSKNNIRHNKLRSSSEDTLHGELNYQKIQNPNKITTSSKILMHKIKVQNQSHPIDASARSQLIIPKKRLIILPKR